MNAIERAPRPDLRVEKQGYSHGPWRVLYAATGEQVWQRDVIDHPNLGRITIPGPVCFQRKRDAVAWVQEQVAKWDAAGPVWVDVIDTPAMPPYGSPERAEVDRLVALVGTVCPACKSEILQRSDGEVFCWDVYCGQQLDAYRKATS